MVIDTLADRIYLQIEIRFTVIRLAPAPQHVQRIR